MTASPEQPHFGCLAVIGLGLIGASVAAGVRRAGLAGRLVAYDQDAGALETGLELGLMDAAAGSIAEATAEADLALVAVPVGACAQVFKQIDPNGKIVTDVGSVKAGVLAAAAAAYGQAPPTFVPGHPIAGSERQGAAAGSATLFAGRRVILTPLEATDRQAVRQVAGLWQALGAEVSQMPPARHDALLARTSHLPHLLAYALVDALAQQDESLEIFQYAAGGFRDFTRIAASDPVMWRDICALNGEQLLAALKGYQSSLAALAALVEKGDLRELEALFKRAKAARDHFAQMHAGAGQGTDAGQHEASR